MGLFTSVKEYGTQLYFRDDGKFTFRKLEIEDTFLVEKVENEIIRGWKHFYNLRFPFLGYGKIGADMVTLGFSRDIILDPFGIVDDKDKPEKGVARLDKPWISEIAETQRYKAQNKPTNMYLTDKITLFLGSGFILMVLAAAIRAVWK